MIGVTFLKPQPKSPLSCNQAFRVFFKMFFGIVVAGGSHGLIFLPLCMSVLGPSVAAKSTSVENISNLDEEAAAGKVAETK